jgi:hypothetical protein
VSSVANIFDSDLSGPGEKKFLTIPITTRKLFFPGKMRPFSTWKGLLKAFLSKNFALYLVFAFSFDILHLSGIDGLFICISLKFGVKYSIDSVS